MSHTNKITFFLPSHNTYKESISKLIYYVNLSRYENMVHLIWNHYGIQKPGKLKYEFMSHTLKTFLFLLAKQAIPFLGQLSPLIMYLKLTLRIWCYAFTPIMIQFSLAA